MKMAIGSWDDSRESYLVRRKELDRCLNAVEEAIERGEQDVTAQLEESIRPSVPPVGRGMRLAEALEHIFASQERLFSCQVDNEPFELHVARRHDDLSGSGWRLSSGQAHDLTAQEITEADAKDLTTRIREGLGEFPLLLLEAHEKRAWVPLRHRSWEQYVRVEFSLSRSRSYELLDQARVIRALRLAASTQRIPPISALAANQIKPLLSEVIEELRHLVSDAQQLGGGDQIDGAVRDVVARARARVAVSKSSHAPSGQSSFALPNRPAKPDGMTSVPKASLGDVIALLAHQAPAAAVMRSLSHEERKQLIDLPMAVRWLEELLVQWSTLGVVSDVKPGLSTDGGCEKRAPRSIQKRSAGSEPTAFLVALR
jgi:hypothetical protein